MSEFKVGDNVRVKKDLVPGQRYQDKDGQNVLLLGGPMAAFRGYEGEIDSIIEGANFATISGCQFYWSFEMLEHVEEVEEKEVPRRLTARDPVTGVAYLVNVKPDEQIVDSPFLNTLQCILDSFERLAEYEETDLMPAEIRQMRRECRDTEKGLRDGCIRLRAELDAAEEDMQKMAHGEDLCEYCKTSSEYCQECAIYNCAPGHISRFQWRGLGERAKVAGEEGRE